MFSTNIHSSGATIHAPCTMTMQLLSLLVQQLLTSSECSENETEAQGATF
jgi:hypothetical protein